MALFKVLRGTAATIAPESATKPAFNDGYAYFTPDDGRFYIDVELDADPPYYYDKAVVNGKTIYRIEIESKTWAELINTKSNVNHTHSIDDIDDVDAPALVNYYGTCSTSSSSPEKIVTVNGSFSLVEGVQVTVRFVNAPAYQGRGWTLNVNGTGAKAIYKYGTTGSYSSGDDSWYAGSIVTFTYNGSAWIINNWEGTTYNVISTSGMTLNNTSAGLITGQRILQLINGLNGFNNSALYATDSKSGIISATDHATLTDLNSNAVRANDVTSLDATLEWNAFTSIADIGGTEIEVSLPEYPIEFVTLAYDSAQSKFVVDKTFNEIVTAYHANKKVYLIDETSSMSQPEIDTVIAPLVAVQESTNSNYKHIIFETLILSAGTIFEYIVDENNSVETYAENLIINDTKNTAGSSNSTSKMFLIGATSQDAFGVTTYSNTAVYATNGALTATSFSGSGANLTSLNAGNISSGTLPVARGGTGQTSIPNIQAGKDGDGNTISSTYLKLSGGTMTGVINSSFRSSSWVNSLTNSAITLTDDTSSYGGWICGPTKNGRIAISTYSSDSDLLYFGYGERGRTTNSFARQMTWNGANGTLTATKVYGAVWNDFAEYRQGENSPGKVMVENGDDSISMSTKRLQPGAMICSDTYGFAIGETDECKCPIAVAGRVLAYPLEPREEYNFFIGQAVCSGPDGTVSIMTKDEVKEYPECVIGYISAVPKYETWGTDNVKVDGRVWIKVK